jgi:hypothetical protein
MRGHGGMLSRVLGPLLVLVGLFAGEQGAAQHL